MGRIVVAGMGRIVVAEMGRIGMVIQYKGRVRV